MMVVHIEPALGTAFVVSFPRDTEVEIEGHGHDKLNAAFALRRPGAHDQDVPQGLRHSDPALPGGQLRRLPEDRRRDRPREDLLPDAGARRVHRALPADPGLRVAQRGEGAPVRAVASLPDPARRGDQPRSEQHARLDRGSPLGSRSHPAPAVLPAQPRADRAQPRRGQPGHRARVGRRGRVEHDRRTRPSRTRS